MVFTKERFDIKYALAEAATDKTVVESFKWRSEEIFVVQKELGGCIVDGKHVLFGALLALIASLIVCVEIILLFWGQQLSISKEDLISSRLLNLEFLSYGSSRRRRVNRHHFEPRQSKAIWGSSGANRWNRCLLGRTGASGHCARYGYNNFGKCREIASWALFTHAYQVVISKCKSQYRIRVDRCLNPNWHHTKFVLTQISSMRF